MSWTGEKGCVVSVVNVVSVAEGEKVNIRVVLGGREKYGGRD